MSACRREYSMTCYPMKARSVNGNSITFSIRDCPKYYDNDVLYLAARPGTELLYLNTITRGSDMFDIAGNRVYEGDIVQDIVSRMLYVVYFAAGFRLSSIQGDKVHLEEMRPFEVVGTVFEYFGIAQIKSFLKKDIYSHIRYKTRDGAFTFKLINIVSHTQNGIIFKTAKLASFAEFDNLLQDTNVKGIYGESLYYSEAKYDRCTVVLKRGLFYYDTGRELIPVVSSKKSELLKRM